MGSALAQWALNEASSVAGAGMGLILGGINDKRQLNQQQKLQDMQIKGQKEMANYNYQQQLGMWNDTNYEAQMKHMKNAGLNPGLMYGMGGGGGTTTGSPSGNVTGAQAPSGGGEAAAMAGMGLQNALNTQLLTAQKDVLESQANLNNVEADKKKGIDTTIAQSQNESILQGVDNLRQDYELKKLDITLKNITNYEQQASQQDRLDYIEYQTKSAIKQFNILANNNKISDATVNDNINRIKTEAIGAVLENILTQSKTENTQSQTQVNREQIKKIANDIMLNWDKLSNDNKQVEIQRQLMQWNTDPNREAIKEALGALNSIIGAAKKGTTIINSYE